MSKPLTREQLKEMLHYCPSSGVFTRAQSRGGWSKNKPCGRKSNGYIRIMVNYKSYMAHHLAWLYMTGEWPELQVDHKDRDRSNNKWDNLRQVTSRTNHRNRKDSRERTGVTTITHKGIVSWRAEYRLKGKLMTRSFSTRKYGEELAEFLATEQRELWETKHGK